MLNYLSDMLPIIGAWILIVIVAVIFYFRKKSQQSNSSRTANGIQKMIESRGKSLGWKTDADVRLTGEKESVTVDHVAVGPFGVMLVCDICIPGNYYGEIDGDTWFLNDEEKEARSTIKMRIENPIRKCRQAEAAVRRQLNQNGLGRVNVIPVVIEAVSGIDYFISGGSIDGKIATRADFRELLYQQKFEKNTGVDVDKIWGILRGEQK